MVDDMDRALEILAERELSDRVRGTGIPLSDGLKRWSGSVILEVHCQHGRVRTVDALRRRKGMQ